MRAARISTGSLPSERVKAAAVPWKPALRLPGGWRSRCAPSIAVMASPSEAPWARLNDTVTDGNCPWWLMTSGSVVFFVRENALSGTALLVIELVVSATGGAALAALAEPAGDRAPRG